MGSLAENFKMIFVSLATNLMFTILKWKGVQNQWFHQLAAPSAIPMQVFSQKNPTPKRSTDSYDELHLQLEKYFLNVVYDVIPINIATIFMRQNVISLAHTTATFDRKITTTSIVYIVHLQLSTSSFDQKMLMPPSFFPLTVVLSFHTWHCIKIGLV